MKKISITILLIVMSVLLSVQISAANGSGQIISYDHAVDDVHSYDCKFNCAHNSIITSVASENVRIVSRDEIIENISRYTGISIEELEVLYSDTINYDAINAMFSSNDDCEHEFDDRECDDHWPLDNCIVICSGKITCKKCGYTATHVMEHEEHTWTNGGVCGRQCTSCGRVEYNPGHGPGSGHSWCTND